MKRRRTGRQRLLIALNAGLVVVALLAAGALAYGYRRVSQINRVELDAVLAPPPEPVDPGDEEGEQAPSSAGPENFLIVGTDSGEGLDPNDAAGQNRPPGSRSDTIMLLRVDPATDRAALLSVPRDLLVPIPGSGVRQRINEAVNDGGPELLIRTIQSAFSIPVHHYVEIDFRGFYELVEAIGGVPVYFPEPVRDRESGLDIPEPGCITLEPEMALAYVRARFYEVFHNGRWRTDPTADLGRITRQQDFVRRALQRAIARGARNPAILDDLLDAAVDNVTVDDRLTPGDLVDLATKFRTFNPDNLETFSLPVYDAVANGAPVLRLREADARPMLDRFRGVEAGTLTPASVMLTVRNGTGQPGFGAQVAADLRAAGFMVPEDAVVDADRFDYERTTVLVPAGLDDAAALVAASLVAGAEVVETDDTGVTGLELVVGRDYTGSVTPDPVVASVPTVPETTASTTTVAGDLPMDQPEAAC